MSRDKQRLPDYLQHIVEAIDRIEHFKALPRLYQD
jgi:hypothetical protein